MPARPSNRTYTAPALALWLERLAEPWEKFFAPDVLETARAIYRNSEIRELHLLENDATVHVRWTEKNAAGADEVVNAHAVIEWTPRGPLCRSTLDSRVLGDALAAAGLYEVEELLGEELSDAVVPAVEDGEQGAGSGERGDSSAGTGAQSSCSVGVHADISTGTGSARSLLLSFSLDDTGENSELLCTPFWEEAAGTAGSTCTGAGTRRPCYGAGAPDASELSSADTGELLRFATSARRAGFTHANNAWRLASVIAASRFVRDAFPAWRKRWLIENEALLETYRRELPALRLEAILDDCEVQWPESGVGSPTNSPTAPSRSPGAGTFRIRWRLRLGDNWLPESITRRFLNARAGAALIPGAGIARIDDASRAAIAAWNARAGAGGSLPRYAMLSLFNDVRFDVVADPALETWRDALLREPPALPNLPAFLRPYQARGVAWLAHMLSLGTHPLLADEMGLGKTVQVLALINQRAEVGRQALGKTAGDTLVVCPASVVPVWAAEARRFFPQLNVRVLDAKNNWTAGGDTLPLFSAGGTPTLWLASYAQLRRNDALLNEHTFALAVLDEAQFIKNPDAQITAVCYRIRAEHRLALTGTPIENHPLDLWSLFHFLMPGLLGKRAEFEHRLDVQPDALADVAAQTRPFVLRRVKETVAPELPPKVAIPLLCPPSPAQREIYRRLAEEGIAALGDAAPNALLAANGLNFLALLTRLRQAACDPALLPGHDALPLSASGKLSVLAERLEEVLANGKKAVVFSQFTSLLDRVRLLLKKHFPQTPRYTLTGATSDRAAPVRAFQETAGAAVMLASLRAGGTGVTLHSAEYVFLLDPWWNPAVEAQAAGRVHRIGQKRATFVYRMLTTGTVEERVEALKEAKAELFANIVGDIPDMSDWSAHFPSLRALVMPEP
jgi:superfamily II DNA or RNA helicase